MYLTPEKAIVIDVEADSLLPTIVWCLCAKDIHTGEEWTFTEYSDILAFIEEKRKAGYFFIAHNGLKYDIPVLNRLIKTLIPVSQVIDTMLLSMIYSPSIDGGHSLEAWGVRIKYPKMEFNDFSKRTPEMLIYCMEDVRLTTRLFLKLSERMISAGLSERGIEIEHHAWWIVEKQRKNGFAFKQKEAHILCSKIQSLCDELQKEIYHVWPPELKPVKEYGKARNGNGEFNANYCKHRDQYPRIELMDNGGYRAYDFVSFDLASASQRLDRLLDLGWQPREPTKGRIAGTVTDPRKGWKVTEKGELVPSLEEFLEKTPHEGARKLVQWIGLNNKVTNLNTWLDAYNEETGCIHGSIWLANTFRYRHSDPNTANIPRIKQDVDKSPLLGLRGMFNYECRDLWTTRDVNSRSLVGVDATGIQFRILAHYLNNKEFTDVVLGGDIHEYNRSKTGHGDRDQNKTFGYAALLGAGAAKVGTIFGVSPRVGGRIKDQWISTVPGLRALYNRLEGELKRTGRITLCDGTRLLVRSPHMVLAYLLQGDESRIMKQAMIYVDRQVRQKRLDALKVGDIHDEWQTDCRNDHTGEFVDICKRAFPEAGRSFNYNIPIACDAKIGKTWAETH